jgi:DUF917 family protein
MTKSLNKQQIKNVLYGATFLGAGGGGSLEEGLNLLNGLDENSSVELIDPSEMEENKYAGSVGGIGAPRAMTKSAFGPEAVTAFEEFKKVCDSQGKEVSYVMGGELGGFNTMVPIYVAIKKGLPFVNGDGNGRAVPELSTGLQPINGVAPYPLVVAGGNGDVTIILIKDKDDHESAENLSRHISMAYNSSAGFCTWPATGEDIINKLAADTITECEKLGEAILKSKEEDLNLENELNKIRSCKLLCKGKIKDVITDTKDGFDFGQTVLQGTENFSEHEFSIFYKNENLWIENDLKEVLLTVPDMVCMINADTGLPITNADIFPGMNLEIYSTFANPNWFKNGKGFDNWSKVLNKAGYSGTRVSFK